MSTKELENRLKELEKENQKLKDENQELNSKSCDLFDSCELRINPQSQFIHWDILDSIPDMIFFKDKDFKYRGGNSHYLKFVGRTLEEILGKDDYALHTKEEADSIRKDDTKILTDHVMQENKSWIVNGDGEKRFLCTKKSILHDKEGNYYGIIGVIKDTTGEQKLESTLQLTNEKLNEAQNIAKIGHWVWDIVEENLWWSDEIYRIFGYEPQEFGATYEAFLNTIHPEDRDTVNNATMHALEHKSKYNVFHRIVLPDGSEKIVHEVGQGTYDSKGNPIQMIGTVQDVTEIKSIENALERSVASYKELNEKLDAKVQEQTAKLVEQSRLAQMGELISMIAHQWRQPLASITAAVSAISFKISLDKYDISTPEGKEAFMAFLIERLQNIEAFAQNLSTTIDDFRNFYQPNKKKTKHPINAPLQASLELMRSEFNTTRISVINNLQSKKEIPVHHNELMQVILNILNNAEDNFVEKEIEERTITISSKDTTTGIRLEISDNGGGIKTDVMKRIFEPYYSTKHDKNGTGLGLYMSKIIVEDHHKGRLSVDNTKDGVRFSIDLDDEQE